MPTLSRGNVWVRRACRDGVFLAAAMLCSYLEFLLPVFAFMPLPGVKLGLANVVTVILFFFVSPIDAGLVLTARVALSALLFGTPVSLFFSAMGGALAFLSLFLTRPLSHRFIGFVGISVLSAAAHQTGQIIAATILFGAGVFLLYLPVLLLAAVLTGTLTGMLIVILENRLERLCKKC